VSSMFAPAISAAARHRSTTSKPGCPLATATAKHTRPAGSMNSRHAA
jgi:hypothetical protein